MQFPAPSPDGSKISFSYYGDIWIVSADGGRAERLTVHTGYDGVSYWSPDGKWITFETDRWGNEDICVIPADGSAPSKRLTYYSMHDFLYGWTPDGEYVLFGSYRHTLMSALYKISINGGLPQTVTRFSARDVCFMPDGKEFYYVRGGAPWWRRKYKGGNNQDIWLKSLPDGPSRRITETPGRDGYPMYSQLDNKLYFLSNHAEDGVNNLWRMDLNGENPEQLTFETEDIHFPKISRDGSVIVYECNGYLYRYDVADGRKKKISVMVNQGFKENVFTYKVFSRDATEFALSPDEKELAFVVHGDIFVMSLKDGKPDKVVQVTNTPYIEKHVSWHPGKELLIFSSREDGDMDICTVEPATEEKFYDDLIFNTKKILDTPETEIKPVFSPDGEQIAYFKHRRELYVMDKDGRFSKKLCPENDVLWMDWSPDSKWITFSRTTLGWREDIFVVPADGSREPVNISNHPNDDYKPMWSSDGRRIAFASRNATGDLWMKYVFLLKEDEEKDMDYWENEEEDTTGSVVVKIDFDNIEERIHTVTKVDGYYNYVAQSPDGKQFAIYSNALNSNDIWTVDWLGKDLKRVTKGNVRPQQFTITEDRKKIFYVSGSGNLFCADITSGQSTPLGFSVKIGIDRLEERKEVFDEAWWALQDGFYDSDFHGIDWRAMYDKYQDRALKMRTIREFHNIIRMMIGELNASHLGVWKSRDYKETTGALGIIYDDRYQGDGVKVKDLIPDSPAAEEKVGIEPGDVITHVNGIEIKKGDNFYALLQNKNGKEIMLTVNKKGEVKNVKVTPETPYAIMRLIDKNWVESNKKYVHKKSDERLGYLYIASMSTSSLKKFENDLYKEMDKDGLIIDIRYNGGGNIHDELLNILRRTAYAYSKERGGDKEYSSLFKWDKPTVLLINEYCYSDAEIFPAGFKELKLGLVVGTPTFGAVIGTNDIKLLDGSSFRVPGTGWFMLNGVNLENTPVEPDIYVENIPEQDGSSEDAQLTRAIEVLLEQIEKR